VTEARFSSYSLGLVRVVGDKSISLITGCERCGDEAFATGSGACYNLGHSGWRSEHGFVGGSINGSTVHWRILWCHRNRCPYLARFKSSFETGGMANPTWPGYRREAHSSDSLYRVDVPCMRWSHTLAVDSKPLHQVTFQKDVVNCAAKAQLSKNRDFTQGAANCQ
jgi:hypothetical protein